MHHYLKTIPLFLPTFVLLSFVANEGKSVSDFSLLNTNGKNVGLKDYPNAKGFMIIFTCNHCPFAKLYPQRLNELNSKYQSLGVPLIAISSTDTLLYEEDTYPMMVAKSKNEKFNYPYLFDEFQKVAKDFKAQKTPHAFVIWKENDKWIVKYSGAIDDNGAEPDKVKNHYVANAVDQLLAGKQVAVKETKSIGCQILMRK
jgi:peroxiredoxin